MIDRGYKCDIEAYRMLKRCSDAKDMTEWNEWRKENPQEEIYLQGACLRFFSYVK
jgi:hypothetical protein